MATEVESDASPVYESRCLMASASITKRGRKYVVRYRLGGRAYPIVHAGSFDTKRDAEQRLTIVKAELALGRNPRQHA